ncbi:TetR/AcrR family transcriptional regulator [Micromonospora sp. NPDC000018]|uniref:TetR/AcrR family transcriptional regulator n=1 Tax=Micromonospora sp. NPDC000018 TaxID=3154239 RepID=UPI0033347D94
MWLDAGMRILAEHGAPALTIERLTGLVGRTKGSFYHHFHGMGGFKTALLAHIEAECTTRFIDLVEADPAAEPEVKLERLLELVLADDKEPRLEVAIRAWAMQDVKVNEAQQRIDQTRVDYLRTLWLALGGDAQDAAHMAQLLYLVLIGAGHVTPAVQPAELRRIYRLAMRLLPARPRN